MIYADNATKYFDEILAVDHIVAEIRQGSVFGLIGSNGAGKSTFIRMIAGIYAPDEGSVTLDGESIYENLAIKQRIFHISDEQYFFSNSSPLEMKNFYSNFYPNFDSARFQMLMDGFGLDENRKIRTFSKGMKKQVSIICGLCSNVEYLLCDETFDGLDPVARQTVKGLFAEDVADRGMTPIIASHNLRELEDICDHVGLLHRGGILFTKDLDSLKLGMFKMQCAFGRELAEDAFDTLDILNLDKRGSLYTITARGDKASLEDEIMSMGPIFFEMLPLTLEEIFIKETEVAGYDIQKLVF